VEKGKLANIRFVQLSYMTVPDSAVKVEDSDLEAYYSAHKKTFEQKEAARKIDYVSFDVVPSAEDRNEVLQWITAKKEEFANAGNDTLFVNQYSDTPFDSSFHAKGTLPAVIDTQLFNAAPGTLIGPYEDGGKFKLSKLTVAAMVPDSVRARHILIKINNNDTAAARSKADSLLRIIRGGMPFEMLAMNNSEDPGSAVKGGDLGWFRKGMMVKPFEEACFNGKVGDMTIVRSQFGYHIIEVTGKGVPSRQVQVATVERAIEPSQKTYDAAYQAAMQFAAAVQGGAAFDSVAAKMGVEKRTAENLRESEKFIAGLDKPREIVRWAYTANLGDLSKVFTVGDKFVIATLVDIREKGFLPLDQVRDQVAAAVRKEKKGELLAEKFKEATGNASNLEAVAQKVGQSVFPAGNISFSNSYIQGMGNEPKVVGQIFAMNQGQLSKPVIGDGGVYVFVVDQLTVPSTTDEEAARKQLADSRRQRSDYEVFNALKEKANVVDRRGRFY
jgi:peptidyl-prolyl cis-trans isomerase D